MTERTALLTLIDGSKWEAAIGFYKDGTPVLFAETYEPHRFLRARSLNNKRLGWIRKSAIISIDP